MAVAPLLRSGDEARWLVSTLGAGVVLESILTLVYTSGAQSVRPLFPLSLSVGNIPFSTGDQLLLIPVAIIAVAGIATVLRSTDAGRCIRAVADDQDAAALRGISVRMVTVGSFAAAGAMAGIAGFLDAPVGGSVQIPLAITFTISGFIAFVVGGTGSIWGSLLGGWIVGIGEALGVAYIDGSASHLFALVVLIVFLLARPQGLFPPRQLRRA